MFWTLLSMPICVSSFLRSVVIGVLHPAAVVPSLCLSLQFWTFLSMQCLSFDRPWRFHSCCGRLSISVLSFSSPLPCVPFSPLSFFQYSSSRGSIRRLLRRNHPSRWRRNYLSRWRRNFPSNSEEIWLPSDEKICFLGGEEIGLPGTWLHFPFQHKMTRLLKSESHKFLPPPPNSLQWYVSRTANQTFTCDLMKCILPRCDLCSFTGR